MEILIPLQNYNPSTPKPEREYIPPFAVNEDGKIVITLSSSQISDLLECERKFYLRQVELIELNGVLKENTPIDLGTFGHSLMEAHYRKGSCLTEDEIGGIRSKAGNDPLFSLNRAGYKQIEHAYSKYVFLEIMGTIKKVTPVAGGVEVGFSEILEETDQYVFILTGRIDLLGYEIGSEILSVIDHKFQMRRRQLYSHSVQFRSYAMIAKARQFIVNYIRLTKEPEFERERILFSNDDHELWKEKLVRIYRNLFNSITHFYNGKLHLVPNDLLERDNPGSCAGKFGYPCQYTKLCQELVSMESPFIERVKKVHYHQVEGHVSWRNEE